MAENVDQDVREAAANTYWQTAPAAIASFGLMQAMLEGRLDFSIWTQALARMKAAGRQQGLREAVEVAQKRVDIAPTLAPNAVSAILDALPDAITALIEGEGR